MEMREYSPDFLSEMRIKTVRRAKAALMYWSSDFLIACVIYFLGSLLCPTEAETMQWLVLVVGTYSFFILLYSFSLLKDLQFVLTNDLKLRYIIKLEIFPANGNGIMERIWTKLVELYPVLANKNGVRFHAKLTSASDVNMDIIADLKQDFLDETNIIVVKIFEDATVGLDEINMIASSLFRYRLLHPLSGIEMVMIVSSKGFTPEAIENVRECRLRGLPKAKTRLIVPAEQTFTVTV
jgi:hypothetical protein